MTGAEPSQEKFTTLQWTSLLTLAAAQFINILDFMIVMPLGPRYMRAMEIAPEQFGYMVASYGFAAFIGGMIASGVIDRFERKRAILVVFGLFTICTFFCGIATSYPLLVLARSATGIFGGVVGSMTMTIVADLFHERRRGFAIGIVAVSFPMASIFGIPLGLWIADMTQSPWKPFLVLGLAATITWCLMLTVLPIAKDHIRPKPNSYWKTLAEQLSIRNHLMAYLFTVFLVFGTFTVAPYIASYMVCNVGIKETEVKYIYILGGICAFVAMPILGRLTDRLGKKPMYLCLASLTILPTIAITNLPLVSLPVALVATTLYMVLTSGRMVPAQALIAAAAVPRLRAGFMSISSAVQHLASGLAASLSASILGENEQKAISGYPLVGVIAIVSLLISLAVASSFASLRKPTTD
jgi:predicted MFS family arabinose efflux permease